MRGGKEQPEESILLVHRIIYFSTRGREGREGRKGRKEGKEGKEGSEGRRKGGRKGKKRKKESTSDHPGGGMIHHKSNEWR